MAGTPPATPPLSSSPANAAPHAGPAWTRNVSKPPSRVRSPYASNAASQSSLSLAAPSYPPPPPQATTNASQGGPSGGSGGGPLTTSTTAAPAHVQTEAPYLTHVQRHHGQLTLVAPDNLGARRQPGTIDPPQSRHDAGGGWGLAESNDAATDYMQPPWIDEELAAEARANRKLKSRKGNKKKDKEQKAKRERAIMSAVANAGKSPAGTSPLPSPAAGEERAQPNLPSPGQLAPSNGTTPRASPGLSSTAPSTRPGMTPRTASGTSSSLHPPSSTAPSRGTRRTRATQGAAGPAGDGRTLGGSSSMTSGSSALGESPHRRPLEGPRPQPSPAGAPAANNPNTQESVRYVAHPNPAFVTTTAPTHSGPLQQSRAVARARAARNAHAAVQQAGIQARAIQAIQAQARAQREELAPPPLSAIPSPSASPASGASASAPSRNQPGAAQRRRNASPANTGTNHSADSDRASGNRQPQRPRMRHRPSEPPVAPETLAPPAQTTPRQGNSAAASARRARSPPRNAPPLSANQPGAASAPGTSDPNVILPPLNLSDPALLEDHLSLGLLDPAMLLMSPPPAYSGRRSLSSTRTIGTPRASYTGTAGESHTSPTSRGGYEAGAAYGLGMDRLRRADSGSTRGSARYSMPPAGSPPPSPSRQSRTDSPTPSASTAATATTMAPYPRARLSPPPPLTSSSSGVSGSESASNSGNVSSSASDEDEDDDDASSFEVTSTDPLVLAWEADRSAGIYSLDERIERDLERRRMAAADETEEVEAGDRSAGAEDSDRDQAERTLTGLTPTGTPTIHVPTDDATGSAAHPANSTTTEEAAADLAQLRRRISHAEASNNSRGVVRALSVHATRSLRAQGRAARERRGRPSELTANAAAPPERSGDEGHRAEPVDETIAEQREEETPPSIVGPAASQASASGVSGTRARSGSASTVEWPAREQPARTLSLRGHRMLAEAAERRLRAEKESRMRSVTTADDLQSATSQGARSPEAGPSSEPAGASGASTTAPISPPPQRSTSSEVPASSSSPPPTPPRAKQPPPPPPPRARPVSGDRSPAPAFNTTAPSIGWGAATATAQTQLRRPVSIRRAPPPPPPAEPSGPELLAARRASLRSVASGTGSTGPLPPRNRPVPPPPSSTGRVPAPTAPIEQPAPPPAPVSEPAPATTRAVSFPPPAVLPPAVPLAPARSPSLSAVTTSSVGASPPRRRPLPVPPTSQNQHRIDAFTALRHSQGFPGYAASPVALEGPSAASPPPPSDAPSGAAGPPLPRRPPQREAPAPPQPTSPVSPPRAVSTADSVESTAPPAPVPAEEASPPSAEQGDADATATMADEPVIVTPPAPQPAPVPELSMYTDLDLLLARLESREDGGAEDGGDEAGSDGGERRGTAAGDSGQNYDDLLLLSDVLGQAVPAGATATELAETLAVARVECERRRVTKNGKVKSKLSVVGVRCVDCAICLARFKVDQFAVALPDCLHIFHEQCIRSWFRLSRVCPVCRHDVFPPRSTPADAQTAGETDAYGLAVAGTAAGGDQDLLA